MSKLSGWQWIKQIFNRGDERQWAVAGIALRNSYVAMLITALGLGLYQGVLVGHKSVLWPTLSIVGLSLLFPLGRRLLLGGFPVGDERIQQLQNQSFIWAYFVIGAGLPLYQVGLAGYRLYRMWAFADFSSNKDPLDNFVFIAPILVGVLVGTITQISYRINELSSKAWLVMALISLLALYFVGRLTLSIVIGIIIEVSQGKALLLDSFTSFILMILGVSLCFVGYIAVSLWAAWRRQRDEQDELRDQQSIQSK